MTTRTVRLDPKTERVLEEVTRATGLSISEVLKRGLLALRDDVRSSGVGRTPYEIYETLDIGLGGDAKGSSAQVRQTVRASIRRKLRKG